MRARALGGSVILGYHRIADANRDPFRLCVSPVHFAQHLDVIRQMGPVPLEQVARHARDGSALQGCIAVTFDDGYVDNLHRAKPLLQRADVPATVHVITGMLGATFWWDELAALVHEGGELRRMHRRLARQPAPQRSATLGEMARHRAPATGADGVRAMTPEELQTLASDRLVSLAAHSVTHQLLTMLPPDGQRAEVGGSKEQLEAILGRTVPGFAYPHGRATSATRVAAREAGFAWASGAHEDLVRPGTDPFFLPRLWAPDVDGERFARWLARWLPRAGGT